MLCSVVPISAVQQSDPVIHTVTFLFSYNLPSCSIPREWTEFPVLYSRTSLLSHSQFRSLHLPTPSSPSIPAPPLLPFGNHKSVLSVCESVSSTKVYGLLQIGFHPSRISKILGPNWKTTGIMKPVKAEGPSCLLS